MVQKRETKAINKLCVREILSLSFVCVELAFFEFCGRNLVCFGTACNFDRGRHWQIRAGSRKGTHACCVFHACRRAASLPGSTPLSRWPSAAISTAETWEKLCTSNSNNFRIAPAVRFYFEMRSR